jgi:hypothetical protein
MRPAVCGDDSERGGTVSDEREKTGLNEGDEDVEAHKNAIQKNALQKDESDEDNDVEAHKNAIQKTSIQ